MDARMQKHQMARWLVGLVAALQLVLFATPSPAQAGVESVAPISGGTAWYNNWIGGPFPSADAACRAPGTCPICGSLTYVGIVPSRNVPGYMDCMFFYNPGGGTPGWNTLSGTAIPYSNAVCPVPAVNPTVPYQYKASSGMCEREAQCPTPNTINPATGQCEPPEKLIITLSGGIEVEPSKGSATNTLPFIATVIDQNTNQPPNRAITVDISLKVAPTSGGHDHGDNTRPRGGVANVGTCSSDATCWSETSLANNGVVVFNFNAPEASGTHTIAATCEGCSNTATKKVDVKINGLNPIPDLPFYALIEANGDVIGARTGWHTDNHNLTHAAAAVLAKIAVNYRFSPKFYLRDPATNSVILPPILHLNDASLPWGGVYDICARPDACAETGIVVWHKPHAEHRRGTVIDVRANDADGAIPKRNRAKFGDYLVKLGLPYLHESQGTSNEHFHIRLMGKKE
jgi:hypothetical protein